MIQIFPILQNESRFFACEYSLQNPSFVECYNVDIKAHIALLVLVKLKHFGFIWSKRIVNIPQSASSIHSMASFSNSFITARLHFPTFCSPIPKIILRFLIERIPESEQR
uniref:Uncharacterized protein n=1 Tax=Opuntia streptacantha TaxID=393608 RepID=A0A7C9E4B7_OPUST